MENPTTDEKHFWPKLQVRQAAIFFCLAVGIGERLLMIRTKERWMDGWMDEWMDEWMDG